MRKQNAAQKFLMILTLVAFLSAGYMAVSFTTSHPAEAGMSFVWCGGPCIDAATGVAVGFAILDAAVGSMISNITQNITAFYTGAMAVFSVLITTNIGIAIKDVLDSIAAVWTTDPTNQKNDDGKLHAKLRAMARQMTVMDASQSTQLTGIIDAANQNRTVSAQIDQKIKSHREQRLSEGIATSATGIGGLTRGGDFQQAYNAAAPLEMAPRSANVAGTPAGTGYAADALDRFQYYISNYCSKNDNNGASGCAADAPYVGRDLDFAGMIFSKDTIDVTNPDTQRILGDMLENIAEPFVHDPVPPDAVNSTEGQAALLAAESYRAKRQVIFDSLYHIVARRVPGSNLGDFIKPLRQKAGIPDALISDSPSHNEIMQAMTSERFRSGQYALQQIDEPENNQREMVVQQAFQIMEMSDQLDLMDRYSLLLASQVSDEIRRSSQEGSAAEGTPQK